MRDDAVPLHLPESQTPVARTPLHRLPGQDLGGAAPPRVDLEIHHMLQPLVVGWIQEDLRLNLTAGVT